ITRLDPAGRHHAAATGFDWKLGDKVAQSDLDAVAAGMAATLSAALRSPPLDPSVRRLYMTDPIEDFGRIEGVIVSGGVGEYVYGREQRDFGDMGRRLGLAFRNALDSLSWPLLAASACIRATALGASEYTVQLSGNTGHISNPGKLLPRRNVQVIHPVARLAERIDPAAVAAAIRAHFVTFDLDNADADVALALRWEGQPEYSRLRAFAEGVRDGLAARIARGLPIYLMLDGDVAMTLGGILRSELGIANDILVIDSVQLRDFDFIDLGRIRLPSGTVPVTIKSLLFQEEAGGARPRQRLHHHGHDHHHHDHDHHHHDHHHGHGHHGGDRKP
ncbi:MAG TPA: ethanolamine ammonia-lyase reactivating factor EutA, partial [Dongiaceae bacterium]|nr:ethanolamine ammonia-lyase reactivating factor EutA [Dongiaceae bacterium]